MNAILFRRMQIDGVNYYQLFKQIKNYQGEDDVLDYEHRDEGEFFYIDEDSDIEIPESDFLNIYYSEGDQLKVLKDSEKFEEVFECFKKEYHIYIRRVRPVKDVVASIRRKVFFQDDCIRNIVNQLYLNQAIAISDLPVELKLSQKNNIFFYGIQGSGKKTIIESIEDELDMPYADVTIRSDQDIEVEIIEQLLDSANGNGEAASLGVVYIRDNFDELYENMGEDIYPFLEGLTKLGPIDYNGQVIDFRTVTFVFLYDTISKTSPEIIENVRKSVNCAFSTNTVELTNDQKRTILYGRNGRLFHYANFLNRFKKKLVVDDDALDQIIVKCSKIDRGMILLNGVIDGIVKAGLINGIDDVKIDDECLELFLPLLEVKNPPTGEATVVKPSKEIKDTEEFYFEKKVDEIFEKATKYVVGQDRAVKLITRELINNLRWANKPNLEKPKDYVRNFLIRGNTGTGKTFIPEVILSYLGVPYFVANATDYTEAGYVGRDVEEMLVGLYHAAGDNLELAERGVLVIDEFDKRASKVNMGFRDVGGGGVQEALYKFAEGTKVRINIGNRINEEYIYFDTSRLTIIFSGAFEGIEEIRDERIGKRKAGFGDHALDKNGKKIDTSITDDDYVKYGMRRQFMRRVKQVIELNEVTKEQLIRIMKESLSSALRTEKNVLLDQGIELEYTESFYDALADKALETKQGVTGIEKALFKVLQSINIEDIRASAVEKIILDAEVIKNPAKVALIPRAKTKVKTRN